MSTPQDPRPEPGQQPPTQQPVPSYGAPPAPAYGAGFSPAPQPPPSKAMAIWALVLSIIACLPISVVLAIMVLVRGRSSRGNGKGLAIAALVINALWAILVIVLLAAGILLAANTTSTEDLTEGTCINAAGLAGAGETVEEIEEVSCTESHDGEVLAAMTLTSEQVAGYDDTAANELCLAAIDLDEATLTTLVADGVQVLGLTQTITPSAGDKLACVGFEQDGSKLTGTLR